MRGLEAEPDAAVVHAVLAGDIEAFSVLVARYRDVYTRFAVRMLGSLEDADDVLQTAFVRAFRKLDHCREPDRFGAWLYQIVINECRTFATRRGRRERRLIREDESQDQGVAAVAPDPALRAELQRALDQLDARYREAFVLKHVEGLNYDEMMELTGLGESALKMRVKRACTRLREMLEGVYP